MSENKEVVYFGKIFLNHCTVQNIEEKILVPKETKWGEILNLINDQFSTLGNGYEAVVSLIKEV